MFGLGNACAREVHPFRQLSARHAERLTDCPQPTLGRRCQAGMAWRGIHDALILRRTMALTDIVNSYIYEIDCMVYTYIYTTRFELGDRFERSHSQDEDDHAPTDRKKPG
jgi:hypothetical protein